MAEARLYTDVALARFYDLDNGWTADRSFCLSLARGCGAVLDLGCGTGDLAIRIAAETGAEVTGADPAGAMLDLARAKPGAGRVSWVAADARRLDLGRRFDLIVMTGHAYQVFLTEADRALCLDAIARHLAPGGRFVFDSRNPAAREWEGWRRDRTLREIVDPDFGPVTAWDHADWDPGARVVTYETVYRIRADGRDFRATSKIGFPSLDELGRLIAEAGLCVDRWLGDWSGAPPGPDSPEFIPLGRLARAGLSRAAPSSAACPPIPALRSRRNGVFPARR